MFNRLTPVVKNILIANVAIHLVASFLNLPLNEFFGLRVVYSDDFAIYQFFTYMWLHDQSSFMHLFGNMLMIFFIGPMLEQVWGSKRFLTFYLVCGIGAGILYGAADYVEKLPLKRDAEAYMANPSPEAFERFVIKHKSFGLNKSYLGDLSDKYYENSSYRDETLYMVREIYEAIVKGGVMVGASGAIYGILFAFAYLFPNTEFLLYFAIPVKAKYIAFGLAMFSIYSEFNRAPGDNVAHLAHLSGMLIAFILLWIWQKNENRFY